MVWASARSDAPENQIGFSGPGRLKLAKVACITIAVLALSGSLEAAYADPMPIGSYNIQSSGPSETIIKVTRPG
jgi:hypothetical protein